MGEYVDSLKFAGGSFSLMPRQAVKEIIEVAHSHDVLVSTGGFIERVLVQGKDAGRCVHQRVRGAWLRHNRDLKRLHHHPHRRLAAAGGESARLRAQGQAGGRYPVRGGRGTTIGELEAEGTRDVEWAIGQAKRFLEAGGIHDNDRV